MPSRSKSKSRCPDCRIRQTLCFCGIAEPLALRTRVSILMHVREVPLTTNTARWARIALSNLEIRLRGEMGRPMSEEGLVPEGSQPLLLYPSEDAIELSAETLPALAQGRPITLVVPDGNWKQASKVGNRIAALKGVPWVKLPPGPVSEYKLRREPHAYSVCTYEAIARALGVIEGPETQARLENVFRQIQDRILYAKGVLPAEQCSSPIPAEDIEWIRASGAGHRPIESAPESLPG